MKRLSIGVMTVCLMSSITIMAQDTNQETSKQSTKSSSSSKEITVTGKLSKDAKGNYVLTEADGTEVKIKVMKGESNHNFTASDLDGRIADNMTITICGKGSIKTTLDGKRSSVISKVLSIGSSGFVNDSKLSPKGSQTQTNEPSKP